MKQLTPEDASKRVKDFHTHITASVEYEEKPKGQSSIISLDAFQTERATMLAKGMKGGLDALKRLCFTTEQ